jgi:hypothetical protein
MLSVTTFEILFQSWQQLPFTCSYRPGKRPLVSKDIGVHRAWTLPVKGSDHRAMLAALVLP